MQHIRNIDEAYDDMLEECLSLDTLFAGRKAYVLKEADPIAYRVGFADFTADGEKWQCPDCEEWYDLEGDSEPDRCEDCEAAQAEEEAEEDVITGEEDTTTRV